MSEEQLEYSAKLLADNISLEKRNKEIYEGFIATTQELCEATKEIERLNSIINEFESWLISWIENEQYCFMSNNPKDRCRREVYEEALHHFKELKGDDKE